MRRKDDHRVATAEIVQTEPAPKLIHFPVIQKNMKSNQLFKKFYEFVFLAYTCPDSGIWF